MLAPQQSNTLDDAALLRKASAGDKQAVSQIYQIYFEPIYQFIRLRVKDTQTAEDLTSSVFIKLVSAFKTGKGPREHLRGWLYKVARNVLHDHYGGSAAFQTEMLEESFQDTFSDDPEARVLRVMDIEHLRRALQSLAPDQLEVILLRFDQHLSLQETADIMGKNLNTIKTLQLRALHKLRQIVQRQSQGGH